MSVQTSDSPPGASSALPPEALLGAWAGSAAIVYCRDFAGRILAANESFARKFGRTVSHLTGEPVTGLIHAEDLGSLTIADAKVRRPPHEAAHEQRWLTPNGWRWVGWEETAVVDDAGTVRGVRAVGHDVTRQRLAEEQYHKLSSAVEQSPIATAITDADGKVQYVNAKFTKDTGKTLEDLLDDDIDILREGHPSEESYANFQATVRAGREWQGELVFNRPDGGKVWESVQISCLRNPAGEITNLLCLRENITERKLLEDQLRQAQKMESLGTLAGGIAHDFNNILAVINGYAEFCTLNTGDTAVVQKSVREIKRAAQRATGLVRQILTFSRKAEVRVAPVDLNQHVSDLIALLAETFPRNITFQLNPEAGLPPLLADHNQLQQIVLNLCVNARDAMPDGGTITITTQRLEGAAVPQAMPRGQPCACLQVTDTGTGMTPEVRNRIFEPFFTTKAGNKGTGLGLAVVYGIVASHEGCIEVDSTVGVGTTFRVCLPLADSGRTAPPQPRPAGEFPGGTESLLIVDDEAPLRVLLESALGRKGYRVASASDGLDAIEVLSRPNLKLDAVLLDLNMPGATGLEVFRVIRAVRPDVRVLIVTGHLSSDARAEFERLGQKDFVRKPYTLEELGQKLRAMLDRPADSPAIG